MEIEKEELKYFQENYRVSNLFHSGDKITVRIVTDNPPENHIIQTAKPTLEDLYLYVFEKENRKVKIYLQKLIKLNQKDLN